MQNRDVFTEMFLKTFKYISFFIQYFGFNGTLSLDKEDSYEYDKVKKVRSVQQQKYKDLKC